MKGSVGFPKQMAGLYPEVEPYDRGMLGVGDGNLIYW